MALDRPYPLSRRSVLSEVGCLCRYLDATRQAAPRSSSPCVWPLSAPPLPPRARSQAVDVGRHTPGWLASGGRLPLGQPAPRQPGEVAGRVPGHVLRVLRSHLSTELLTLPGGYLAL